MGSPWPELLKGTPAEDVLPRRLLMVALARVLGILAGTLAVYFLVPIEGSGVARAAALAACVGIATILTVFARQMSRVSRSRRPALAALEALVLVFGLFLCFFALLYVSLSANDPGAFTQDVDKVAGIYFTTTILTTVGFGDISPVSDTARIMVTLQMVLGLILLGTAVKALAFSAKRAVTSRTTTITSDVPEGPRPEGGPGTAGTQG